MRLYMVHFLQILTEDGQSHLVVGLLERWDASCPVSLKL
jgi:hypothetical protein